MRYTKSVHVADNIQHRTSMCDVRATRDNSTQEEINCQHVLEKLLAQNWIQHYNTYEVMLHNKVNILLRVKHATLVAPRDILVALPPPNSLVTGV